MLLVLLAQKAAQVVAVGLVQRAALVVLVRLVRVQLKTAAALVVLLQRQH